MGSEGCRHCGTVRRYGGAPWHSLLGTIHAEPEEVSTPRGTLLSLTGVCIMFVPATYCAYYVTGKLAESGSLVDGLVTVPQACP